MNAPIVFHDPTYPAACPEASLERLLPGPYRSADATHLAEALATGDTLVSLHGGHFPAAVWPEVLRFLERGGNLAIFGGTPFSCPVATDGQLLASGVTHSHTLLLGVPQPLALPQGIRLEPTDDAALLEDLPLSSPEGDPGLFWALQPKLTQAVDHPHEAGSGGPLDTTLTPLVRAVGDGGWRATPVFLLEHYAGRFRGGRWLLSPWQPPSTSLWEANAEALARLIRLADAGATHCEMHPVWASYRPGEPPHLTLSARAHRPLSVSLAVRGPGMAERHERLELPSSAALTTQSFPLPATTTPGLYEVETRVGERDLVLRQRSGFWVWDETLIQRVAGQRLSAGHDHLLQNGAPWPVFGTTYMDSAVQRHFLTRPNPVRWSRDLAELRAAGVNLIRTGLWNGWRQLSPLAGVFDEARLRALDALVMSAAQHELQLIFTLFAFAPPAFEGDNPWFDPRATLAQQDLVAHLARRYADVALVSWDLINEPSLGRALWSVRPLPSGDRFEAAAFRAWLMARSDLDTLRQRWRLTQADLPDWTSVRVPTEADYSLSPSDERLRHPFRAADYSRFSQDAFRDWAQGLRATIRAAGSQSLIAIGQDEAELRPAPLLHADVSDYTSQHPWWRNDDLLWGMLLAKAPGTPSLAQEVGVMTVPRAPEGHFWRSEEDNAALLERKLVTALAARAAGVVQWLWHTNAGLKSDNENGIGLVRADGSAKPEREVFLALAPLMHALKGRLLEPEPPPEVWLVVPFALGFVNPGLSREATQRAVRVLGYDLGVVPQLVADERLKTVTATPKVVIVPGAQLLAAETWQALLRLAHGGTTVLVSGVLGRDAYALPFDPAPLTADKHSVSPVSPFEPLTGLPSGPHQLRFVGEGSFVLKAHNRLTVTPHGAGRVVWWGLPLELASSPHAVRAVYHHVFTLDSTLNDGDPLPTESPLLVAIRPLLNGQLALLVNESSAPQRRTVFGRVLEVAANRAGAALLTQASELTLYGGVRLG